MIDFSKFNSLISLTRYFNNPLTCYQALTESRWMTTDGELDIVCPYCGHLHCRIRKDSKLLCGHCRHNFTSTKGTIFASTKITIQQWFIAMYLISSHKKGVSSCQLARDIEVTQPTAWYMLQKVRSLFAQDATILINEPKVEMDEAYIGGAEKNKHADKKTESTQGRSTKTKTAVFGMYSKESKKVAVKAVKDSTTDSLKPIIEAYVNAHAELFTDEHSAYNFIDKKGQTHYIVNHSGGEYSKGDGISTNLIECFWSHFKRMIDGIYHHISKKQLQRYIDEATYRWNTKDMCESARFHFMFSVCCNEIGYADIREYKTNYGKTA